MDNINNDPKALSVVLTAEEMAEMERVAAQTDVNTRVHRKNR